MSRQVSVVIERTEELPAATELVEMYEELRAVFADDALYALVHRMRTSFAAPRARELARTEKLRELLQGPLDPADRVQALLDGLADAFHDRREALAECATTEQVQKLLSLNSRQALAARVEAGQVLAVKERDELRYPVWQFDATTETGVLQGLRATLDALKERDPMWTLLWMRTTQRALDGRTPAEALRAGDIQLTVEVARAAVAD